jgi:hypothetical protein
MPLVIVCIIVFLLAAVGLEAVNWYRRPEPLAKGAVPHHGATEGFGKELRGLKNAPFARELERRVTPAEQYSKDWWELHDATLPALTEFIANVNTALDHFLRDMPTLRMEIA